MATKRSKAPATRTVWDVSKLRGSGDKVAASRACLAESFAESLSSFGNYLVSSKRDEVGVDAVCAEWCSRVEKGARESGVSKLKKVHRTFSKNWFDAELQAKVSQRQEAWKKACETLTDADLREYFSLRADGRKMAKAKKRQSWDELMDKLSNEFKAHNKLFFSTLNRSAGKRGNADIGPIRDGDGVLRFEETEKREAIAAFYEKLGQPVLESKLIDGGTVVDGKVVHSRYDDEFLAKVTKNVILYARLSNDQEDTEADCPIVASEVASVLKDLKLGAPGGDKLPPDFLKFGGEAMLDSLCSLFNYVLDRSVIPESWGKALVVLLFKDGSREDPGNYRGISLLDIVGKVFAKVCARRLEKQVSMAREQAGFTAGRGCEYNLYVLLQVLQRRKFEGKDTFLFFLDVRKAFDTVWRDGLLEKLWGLGVKGKLWRAFRAMYAKNKSAILVNGVPTRWFDVLQGTRQGATESPLLFKIFIDGLVEELAKLKLGIEIDVGKLLDGLLFADDIVLAAASREDLQKMIGVVEAYSRKWRFEENLAKCGVMSVLAKRGPAKSFQSLKFLGQSIPDVEVYKYLGVMLHSSLSWETHVEYVCKRAKKAVDMYASTFANRNLPVKLRLSVYKQLVRPNFDYASGIWSTDSKQESRLEAVQLGVLRQILQCNSKTNNTIVRASLGVVPLCLRRARFVVSWYTKLLSAKPESLLRDVPRQDEWGECRIRGRHQMTWYELLEVSAEKLGTSAEKIKDSYLLETVEKKLSRPSELLLNAEHSYSPVEVVPLRDCGFVQAWSERLKGLHLEAHEKTYLNSCHDAGRRSKAALFFLTQPEARLNKSMEGPLRGAKLINFRLRTGTHALRSDQYHRDGCSKECPCCGTALDEDVAHFLLHCRKFNHCRSEWMAALRDTEWGKMHWNEMYVLQDELGKCATLLGYPPNGVYSGGVGGRFPETLSNMHLSTMYEARSQILEKASLRERALEDLAKKESAKRKQKASRSRNAAAASAAVELEVKAKLEKGESPGLHAFFSSAGSVRSVPLSAPKSSSLSKEKRAGSHSPSGTYEC